MSSRQGKKPIKKESNSDSDFDDFIIVKQKAKMPQKDLTMSQIIYNIITSDFVKGLSQDMIKFVAMFLLTSYLRGEPLPLHIFNRAINREVNEASTAVNIATQTDPQLYDEEDPEYRLPVMLNALREFEESKDPETKTDIDAVEEEFGLEFSQLMEEFTNPKMGGLGLNKKLKGGGQGTRNAPRSRLARPPLAELREDFQYDNISEVIAEAIEYARRNNIPSRVLRTVLELLARAAVFLLIYGVIHVGATSIQYLIDNYMDYKAMFVHYMKEYKNKRMPKTANDISEDAEHYKSWAKENIGGDLKKVTKKDKLIKEEMKEIEESNWFKKFYKNTIKPTATKIYDVATSDEAITAAKITAQLLILSLLMYTANETRGAMYEYIGKPAYDKTMQAYHGMQNPLKHLNERDPELISLDPDSPNYRNPDFNPSRNRLDELSYENRLAFFKQNPKSTTIKHYPEITKKVLREYKPARPETIELVIKPETQRDIKLGELRDLGSERIMEYFKKNPESGLKEYFTEEGLLSPIYPESKKSNISRNPIFDAMLYTPTEESKENKPSVKERAKAIESRNPKPVVPKKTKGARGIGLSDHKNKFYEFIASKDAKNMAKATAVGLITTVLTILASQGAKKNISVASISPSESKEQYMSRNPVSGEDLSYYGIPN